MQHEVTDNSKQQPPDRVFESNSTLQTIALCVHVSDTNSNRVLYRFNKLRCHCIYLHFKVAHCKVSQKIAGIIVPFTECADDILCGIIGKIECLL